MSNFLLPFVFQITKICKIDEWLDGEIYPFLPYMNEVIMFGTEQGLIYIMDLHLSFVYCKFSYQIFSQFL